LSGLGFCHWCKSTGDNEKKHEYDWQQKCFVAHIFIPPLFAFVLMTSFFRTSISSIEFTDINEVRLLHQHGLKSQSIG
jgi:hypothetical protein